MIQQTSLQAFTNVCVSLGERQQRVLDFFYKHKDHDFTNTEVADRLLLPINCVTPRVNELRKKGLLIFSQRRYCFVTGRYVMAWRLK